MRLRRARRAAAPLRPRRARDARRRMARGPRRVNSIIVVERMSCAVSRQTNTELTARRHLGCGVAPVSSYSIFLLAVASASVIAVAVANCTGSSPMGAGRSSVLPRGGCDVRVPTNGQVSRILGARVMSVRVMRGDSETCELASSARLRVYVSLRPRLGRLTVQSWVDAICSAMSRSLGRRPRRRA